MGGDPTTPVLLWAPDIYGNVSEQELMWAKVRLSLPLTPTAKVRERGWRSVAVMRRGLCQPLTGSRPTFALLWSTFSAATLTPHCS